jgi:uncharacterized membrane protein
MLWRIRCPGLYYDELWFVNGWRPNDLCAWCPGGVPVMSLSYLGAIKTWLYWPVAEHLSPAMLRVPTVLAAALSLVLAYAATRRLAGRGAALLAAALLAVDPAFLFFQRLDWGPVAIGILLRAGSLLLLVQWRDQGGSWRLVATAFLLGLGLYDKVIFAWYVAALAVALVATRRSWPAPSGRVLAASAAALTLGAAPLLVFNVATPLATFRQNAFVERVLLVPLIRERLELIAHTLDGRALYEYVNQQPLTALLPCPQLPPAWGAWLCGPFPLAGSLFPLALAIALGLALLVRPLRTDVASRLLAVLVAGTAAMMVPVPRVGPHHVPVLLPFPQMLVAVVAARCATRWPRWRAGLALTILLVIASAAAVSIRTAVSFAGLCGRSAWSAAIYRVADFVAAHPHDRILLGDWGFNCQLRALSPTVPVDDVSWALIRGDATPAAFRPVVGRRTFLLLHHRRTEFLPQTRRRAFALLRAAGLRARKIAVLRDLDGRPTTYVVELLGS